MRKYISSSVENCSGCFRADLINFFCSLKRIVLKVVVFKSLPHVQNFVNSLGIPLVFSSKESDKRTHNVVKIVAPLVFDQR